MTNRPSRRTGKGGGFSWPGLRFQHEQPVIRARAVISGGPERWLASIRKSHARRVRRDVTGGIEPLRRHWTGKAREVQREIARPRAACGDVEHREAPVRGAGGDDTRGAVPRAGGDEFAFRVGDKLLPGSVARNFPSRATSRRARAVERLLPSIGVREERRPVEMPHRIIAEELAARAAQHRPPGLPSDLLRR